MLKRLEGVVPSDWLVVVMADRGLYAAWLYRAIQQRGWHPLLRVKAGLSFRGQGEAEVRPIGERVSRHGRRWEGEGVGGETGEQMEGTLVVCWEKGYEEKLAMVTDLSAEQVQVAWYQMRYRTRRRIQGSQKRRMGMGTDEDERSGAGEPGMVGDGSGDVVGGSGGWGGGGQRTGRERSEERRVGKGCRSGWSPYH